MEPMGDAYDEALRRAQELQDEADELRGLLQDALSCLDEIYNNGNYAAARLLVAEGRQLGVEVSG